MTICFSGVEGEEGRALSLVASPDVALALEVLAHDTGLDVETAALPKPTADRGFFRNVDLFVAVVRHGVGHLPLGAALGEAAPVLLAAEATDAAPAPCPYVPTRFALDTRAMAELLADLAETWRGSRHLDQEAVEAAASSGPAPGRQRPTGLSSSSEAPSRG